MEPLETSLASHASRNGVADELPEQMRGDAWEPPLKEQSPPTPTLRFSLLGSRAFEAADYLLEWLVKKLLIKGQPGVIAGPKKAMKTSLIVDLGVSLAKGDLFLGEFTVYQRRRVAIFSGESGPATLQETFRRVCRSKQLDPKSVDGLLWGFDLPQFAFADDLKDFKASLTSNEIEVVIVDPAYLCVLAGVSQRGPQASNAFQMGPLYKAFADACLFGGATPILAAHFKITRQNVNDPPELDDLTHAGIQEWVRQWLLIGRRERYQPGTGQHRLWLSAGGSAGQSGLWTVDIEEGVIREDFSGRFWNVHVETAPENRQTIKVEANKRRQARVAERDRQDDHALLDAVDRLAKENGGVAGYTKARDLAALNTARMTRAMERLKDLVEEAPFVYASGHDHKSQRTGKGLRRRSDRDKT